MQRFRLTESTVLAIVHVVNMKSENRPEADMYVVIDPNWGDPRPIPETEAETVAEATAKAVTLRDHALYSGASLDSIPPKPGKWENMHRYGYRVENTKI
jgi:hypothetical protein